MSHPMCDDANQPRCDPGENPRDFAATMGPLALTTRRGSRACNFDATLYPTRSPTPSNGRIMSVPLLCRGSASARIARLLGRWLTIFAVAGAVRAATPPSDSPLRGGKFEWARLETSEPYWDRHIDTDPSVITYLRRSTSLNIDPKVHIAKATSPDQLRRYPLIFCKDLSVFTAQERRNFAEYLRRGGFMLIDACRNEGVNSNPEVFLQRQTRILKLEFPDVRVVQCTRTHEVFSIFFKMSAFPPARPQYPAPLFAVLVGDRVVGFIGLNGFMCAAQGIEGAGIATDSTEMMVNIYIYALTH
jgi:hypothetical protein